MISQISNLKKSFLIGDWPGKLVIKKYIRDLKKVLKLGLVYYRGTKIMMSLSKDGRGFSQKHTHLHWWGENCAWNFQLKAVYVSCMLARRSCKRFTGLLKKEELENVIGQFPIGYELNFTFVVLKDKRFAIELILGHFITLWVAFWV